MTATTARRTVAEARPALPVFEFRGRGQRLRASGDALPLPAGGRHDLQGRVSAAFAERPGGVVAGAIPFRDDLADALWSALPLRGGVEGAAHAALPADAAGDWHLEEQPSGADYAAAVEKALQVMAAERDQPAGLRKVVLARSLLARASRPIALAPVLDRLSADPAVTGFLTRLPDLAGQPRHLIGATPELLLRKTGALVSSHPLAGSARRNPLDPAADRAAAAALDGSEKDRREHRYVVEFILDTLAPFCRDLSCPEGTVLTSTGSMWHLGTRIEGRLRDPATPSLLLTTALHPTPAVCGLPQGRAAAEIARLEPVARGFYSGAVGWCEANGDGAWFVTIRCAEVTGAEARLYAGAGVVLGSDPEAERAETAAKFAALLAGLGLDGTTKGTGA